MKKSIILFAVISGLFSIAFADVINSAYEKNLYQQNIYQKNTVSAQKFIPVQAPDYVRFYNINSESFTAIFVPLNENNEKLLSGNLKNTYKKAKKIENYISQKNFSKAVNLDTEFLPTHIKYFNYLVDINDLHSAMNEMIIIKRLNSRDRVLDDNVVSYKLGMLYYMNKNYASALTYLSGLSEQHNPSEENLWFALSDIYYNLNNFESSIKFGQKIPTTSIDYPAILEILYKDYYNLKDIANAEKYAQELVRRKPSAINYIRLAAVSSKSDSERLNMLNRARNLALTMSDYDTLIKADAGIARLEQKKIDTAVEKLSGFVEKPDWNKITQSVASISEPIELSERQQNFFKSTNNCIAKYNNNDLIRCFEYINREEVKITSSKINEYQQAYAQYLQQQQQLQRQQEFLERTYYQRMYMDDFMYMRDYPPYFVNTIW